MTSGRVARDPVSCVACLAWGSGFNGGLCRACYDFAYRWPVGDCGACGRRLPVKKCFCRLCWCQARLDRSHALGGATGTYTLLLPYVRLVQHQQLFLANMPAPRDLIGKRDQRRHGVGHGAPGITRKPAPPVVGLPPVAWLQPALVDPERRYHRRHDLRTNPTLDNPWLGRALHLAHAYAQARGIDAEVERAINRALVMLLAEHAAGDTIRYSDIHRALRRHGSSALHVAYVLADMGVLADDRQRAFDSWIRRRLSRLAPAIARHVQMWGTVLLDGDDRVQRRSESTVRGYVTSLSPVLADWSARYEHLREIMRDDVTEQINLRSGTRRRDLMLAMRSLFRWAKKNGIIFRDPTSRIRLPRPSSPLPQPLTADKMAPVIQAASRPHLRLAVVLAAVHAAQLGDIINLQVSDVDIGDRLLTIAGRTRPMDELTRRALEDWLDYRRGRWPNTANPHLLVSARSAVGLGPVSRSWLGLTFRGLPATLDQLRIDRCLDEAIVSGADPLHVALVLNLCETTAIRYAAAARQILATGVETQAAVHSEPPDRR